MWHVYFSVHVGMQTINRFVDSVDFLWTKLLYPRYRTMLEHFCIDRIRILRAPILSGSVGLN
jgi:hypothetical protein